MHLSDRIKTLEAKAGELRAERPKLYAVRTDRGHNYGSFRGRTPAEALEAFARDHGYDSYAQMERRCIQLSTTALKVSEVSP